MQSQAETAVATHRNNPGKTFLNHFFVVLEPKDYEAIRTSDFLKNEYGVFEERTTVRDDVTYKGIYLYGKDTSWSCSIAPTRPTIRMVTPYPLPWASLSGSITRGTHSNWGTSYNLGS